MLLLTHCLTVWVSNQASINVFSIPVLINVSSILFIILYVNTSVIFLLVKFHSNLSMFDFPNDSFVAARSIRRHFTKVCYNRMMKLKKKVIIVISIRNSIILPNKLDNLSLLGYTD